jgi:protein-S-isoprenylcysteine O-methyltransferase Ste14
MPELSAQDSANVIAPPPLVFLAGLGVGFGLQAALGSTPVATAAGVPVGLVCLAVGSALARGFLRAFKRAGTPLSPYRESTQLVMSGPYRLTRNPAYLGFALIYCAIAVLAASLWVLAALPAVLLVIDRGVIAREERFLERKFGEPYRLYKQRTRRWL